MSRSHTPSHFIATTTLKKLLPKVTFPVVIKPCEEDNSTGVTLVHTKENFRDAVEKAFQFDDTILIEQYIPLRRELRVGTVEKENGALDTLPVIEYFVTVPMIN